MTFTPQPMAKAFGWQGDKQPLRGSRLPRAALRSLGNVEPGRVAEFEQGVRDGIHQRNMTALKMAGAYVAVKAWSQWHAHLEKP
jgi:hypothetical protein